MTKKESVDAASMHPTVHTPGPWMTYDIFGGKYQEVFGPRTPGKDRLQVYGKADARLISAAPELLAACELVALWMLGGQPGPHSDSVVLEQVKSAIHKATS
jgi:hypothetical protein